MMSDFRWSGILPDGKRTNGTLTATKKESAKRTLHEKGITVLSLSKSKYHLQTVRTKKLSPKQRLDFTQQLYLLLRAGVSLTHALDLIEKTTTNTMKQLALILKEKITAGESFSSALAAFPAQFNQSYCQVIATGEQSGKLDVVLQQLIQHQEQLSQIKNKISKALFYPISVLIIAIGITLGLLIFVIPQFSAIYHSFGAQLPAITRTLILASQKLMKNGLYYILMLITFFWIFKILWQRFPILKKATYSFILKIPLFRTLITTQILTQWSQVFSTMLLAGIPLIDALKHANQTITHPIFSKQMHLVTKNLINGQSFFEALNQCPLFPLRAKHLIGVGENADSLDIIMEKIAILYQQILDQSFDHLSKTLEPVIMVGIATLVAGLVIAMYLPIFQMGKIV